MTPLMSNGAQALWIGVLLLWSFLVFFGGMIVGSIIAKKFGQPRHWWENYDQ